MDDAPPSPFAAFLGSLAPQTPLRAAITAACRRPEPDCVRPLLDAAAASPAEAAATAQTARRLVEALRAKPRGGGVEGLIQEYDLSSAEGVALMCLAEALLRIPDNATRDALIRDKIGNGDWRSHLGQSPSLFVNAATWGLLVTGRLTATANETGLSAALTRLIARGGEPIIRRGTDLAMRLMGEQFVTGQTVAEALRNSRRMEARGFRYSYDMLGEAALTAADAARYLADYENAIGAIGRAAAGRGPVDGPGVSIKLSALHPRYGRQQRDRVLAELLPRVRRLAIEAKAADIGLNVDAEEADRLELSLDLLEALAGDPELAGWAGLGFVVQAYGKRCPFVLDWIMDLARRNRRRLMIRLVKGAYWDSEIKRAQVDGLSDFPVFTRKAHTDVSFLACARKLLGAGDAVFPQFATHNAQTVARIVAMAGPGFRPGDYEFQCLHGMGEPLYEEVVGPEKLDHPCRIYAPVGTHETLLAYLVRRLLENGANASFVNRVADPAVSVEALIADPVETVRAMPEPGTPHPAIRLPRDLTRPGRANSAGLDLASEDDLLRLGEGLRGGLGRRWTAEPTGGGGGAPEPVRNPADHRDVVGTVQVADAAAVSAAVDRAEAALPAWRGTTAAFRAAILRRAADALEARTTVLVGLIVREAGKSFANAVGEVREAVDFLRYYAAEAERTLEGSRPLGIAACISPWNFPLAIFTGQVAAALAAGNLVLAKPAEETPLIAAEAVRILHEAGLPPAVLQLVPGAGETGAALVADPRVAAVLFTGSTEVARSINRTVAGRLGRSGRPVVLVAETGGQNALVADSSALAEQVVADAVTSAFDSAGQRCSALRIVCVQDEVAERTLAMLHGAVAELRVGDPGRLETDVGPVISAEAQGGIEGHVAAMRGRGHRVTQPALPSEAGSGTFVPPTVIEIGRVSDVGREVFGPVLHVLRYQRDGLDRLLADLAATGYALTFGLHTRLDETIAHVAARVEAGNVYVNRTIIGATVGVQPFGGSALSGTGPKAGGPLALGRLVETPPTSAVPAGEAPAAARLYAGWLRETGQAAIAGAVDAMIPRTPLGVALELPGPVGERNVYRLRPRGRVAVVAEGEGLFRAVGAVLATGNRAVLADTAAFRDAPETVLASLERASDPALASDIRAVVTDRDGAAQIDLTSCVAERDGPIVPVLTLASLDLCRLVDEVSVSTNTAAAGGNASLMAIG